MVGCWILIMLCVAGAEPIALDNGAIRVEVDPSVFSVRFIGRPGGRNLLEPAYVSHAERNGAAWLDPGGLVTDVIPLDTPDAALRRGPAEVIDQDAHSVVLLGAVSEPLGLRLRKEIRLEGDAPRARFAVTLLSTSPVARTTALRNTARVPLGSVLCGDGEPGMIRPFSGTDSTSGLVAAEGNAWRIPIPPRGAAREVILGAFLPEVRIVLKDTVWRRRIWELPAEESAAPYHSTFLCVLDDTAWVYGAVLQSARAEVSAASPLVFTEEWRLEKGLAANPDAG